MCMRASRVLPYQRWNWAGDEIVPDSTIPASRRLVGKRRSKPWTIDVRRFLTGASNSVVSTVIGDMRKRLSPEDRETFRARSPGSFDFRRSIVVNYFKRFRYLPLGRQGEEWLLPEETLALGGGDCEDLAFLLASLLEGSGISPYCIRVCLGAVVEAGAEGPHHHAWVAYLNETGGWEILEPLAICADGRKRRPSPRRSPKSRAAQPAPDIEYIPIAVFNSDHLWWVRSQASDVGVDLESYLSRRHFWGRFKPGFAAQVHDGIIDDALPRVSWFTRQRLKWASLALDVDTLNYDPRDHFDFSYLKEGWARVGKRLATGGIVDLAYALHSICDFYAHTTYAEFAGSTAVGIELYDPQSPFQPGATNYNFEPFAPIEGTSRTPAECAALWEGKIISGQWWRSYATFPNDLQRRSDLEVHRSLPDHDYLAVDKASRPSGKHKYSVPMFEDQFRLRRHAAVQHVRKAYSEWQKMHP
jgi:hypothetical protein